MLPVWRIAFLVVVSSLAAIFSKAESAGAAESETRGFNGEGTRRALSWREGDKETPRSAQCVLKAAELLGTGRLSCVGRESEAA